MAVFELLGAPLTFIVLVLALLAATTVAARFVTAVETVRVARWTGTDPRAAKPAEKKTEEANRG